ncbi:FecR family protein [Psychroserpens damuponensis]|uniref:FecR family protein n=1 Tax=Psychroserpens damuponensis TaxID=943936 RepID=UPI0006950CB9|nr:FecR family protein [Psychroserpens damuponensis]
MKEQDLHNNSETFLAKWLVGELSDKELKVLVSEADFNSYVKIREGLNIFDVLESSSDASFMKIQDHISKSQSQDQSNVRSLKSGRWLFGIAASVVLLIGLFFILGDDIVTLETNYGDQKTMVLLDGSEVILNSKSTLTYNKDDWEHNRTLNLKGEGFFKVKKGSAFTVITDNGTVTVLGTQFNVNSQHDLFEVRCFEGKVRVKSNDDTFVLLPTNTVRRINGFAAEQWESTSANPSWLEGESTFKSVPLKYVITSLESQYNIAIDTTNINSNLIYTGSFTHKDLNTALKTVFNSLQIRFIEKEKGNIYLSTK